MRQLSAMLAPLSRQLADQMRATVGTLVLVCIMAVLALTAWIAAIAGLIAILSPYWGLAISLLFVAGIMTLAVLVGVFILRRRTQDQRVRAAIAAQSVRQQAQSELLTRVPEMVRTRPGLMLITAGLALGAMIVTGQDAEKDPSDAGTR